MMIESTIDSDVMNVDDNVHIEYQNERRVYHILCIQRPFSVTQETPRGGGLDLFPKKREWKNNNKQSKNYLNKIVPADCCCCCCRCYLRPLSIMVTN